MRTQCPGGASCVVKRSVKGVPERDAVLKRAALLNIVGKIQELSRQTHLCSSCGMRADCIAYGIIHGANAELAVDAVTRQWGGGLCVQDLWRHALLIGQCDPIFSAEHLVLCQGAFLGNVMQQCGNAQAEDVLRTVQRGMCGKYCAKRAAFLFNRIGMGKPFPAKKLWDLGTDGVNQLFVIKMYWMGK